MSDDNAMAAMMKQYTESMQAQFGSMMDKFRTSMQQSVGMAQMMNNMMEQLVLQNLHVTCLVQPATPVTLHLELRNTGTIAIPVVSCTVTIHRRSPPTTQAEEEIAPLRTIPADLDVNGRSSHVIPLELPKVDQYNGQVVVSCVSPGTGLRLQKAYEFSVYLLQQGTIQAVTGAAPSFGGTFHTTTILDLQRLREILRIAPADGVMRSSVGHYIARFPTLGIQFAMTIDFDENSKYGCYLHVHGAPNERFTPEDIAFEFETLARLQ
ncbi:hypothetical protein LEN26_021320 [Aphanomyces euteiches]|nr:hypothetical protein LEN26_021320 [Aphanomyces euteiches]KAH9104351.1 hypothetical protein AeMF1_019550 [Aphanomyces euteiches]KAH9189712.1 hypothetical protein AeNC1_008316 [Aphanomyces euteiches]